MNQHEQLLYWLFENSSETKLYLPEDGHNSVQWDIAGTLPEKLYNFFLGKFKTKSWQSCDEEIANDRYYRGIVTYTPSGKLYWNRLYKIFIELRNEGALYNVHVIQDCSEEQKAVTEYCDNLIKENEVAIVDENDFDFYTVLHIEIGGYEYDINPADPKAKDVQAVFEEVVKALEKLAAERARLEAVALNRIPAVVIEALDQQEAQYQELLNKLNEL